MKILVPVDGSENSKRALQHAMSMANNGALITVLHVIEVPPTVYVQSQKLLDQLLGKFREEAAQILDGYKALAREKGLDVEAAVIEGDVAESIVDYAQKGGFDMIVMGSRGLGRLKEMVLGGTSSNVLHNAKIPVLIVK